MRLLQLKMLTVLSLFSGCVFLVATWQVATSPISNLPLPPDSLNISYKSPVPLTVSISPPEPLAISFERPLFRPNRRPFDPAKLMVLTKPTPPPPLEPEPLTLPVEENVPAAPVFPQLTLRGVHMTNQTVKALIESPEIPLGSWITVGTVVLNWHLKTVTSDSVTFTFGDRTQILKLYVDNPTNSVGNPQ
jgi:hypothetical protein